MDIWRKPGQYCLTLPEAWSITDLGDTAEMEPARRDAAVHVSVYRKTTKGTPEKGEARTLVENFASKNQLELSGDLDFDVAPANLACVGHFIRSDQPTIWIVKSLVGMQRAVLCTVCTDMAGGPSYSEGAEILESVVLEED